MSRLVAAALLSAALPLALAGQPASPPPRSEALAELAGRTFDAGDWAAAAAAYQEILASEPANAEAWYRLGAARHALGAWREAAEAYRRAGESGYSPVVVATRRARVLARAGDVEAAFGELERAIGLGLGKIDLLRQDPDFAPLRSDPRFAPLVAKVELRRHPCRAAEHRTFDFWVGDWDVQVPEGKNVATSHITSVADGCAIHEDFAQNDGSYSGQSLSAWDGERWRQRYVDSGKGIQDWEGVAEGAGLRFLRDGPDAAGKPVRHRMTYTPLGPDRVRQLLDHTADDGATWTVDFDGLYVRRKE